MRESQTPSHSDLKDVREKVHLLEGLNAALNRWSDVSMLAFETKSPDSLTGRLMELLDVDAVQAIAISDLQVRKLNQQSRSYVKEELAELRAYLDAQ